MGTAIVVTSGKGGTGKTSITGGVAGSLARVVQAIGEMGFNMECIKSRPLPHVPFEYYFYVQLVCPAGCDAAACNRLLETLTGACSTLRLLGAFTLDGIDQQ